MSGRDFSYDYKRMLGSVRVGKTKPALVPLPRGIKGIPVRVQNCILKMTIGPSNATPTWSLKGSVIEIRLMGPRLAKCAGVVEYEILLAVPYRIVDCSIPTLTDVVNINERRKQ